MRLTARARVAGMAAVLAVPLAVAGTVVASGPAAAAPVAVAGGGHAVAVADGARVPAGLARAVEASHGSGVQLGPAGSLAWSQSAKLTAGGSDAHFGQLLAVSSDGTTAAIVAPTVPTPGGMGAVFVYKNVSGKWTRTAKLTGGPNFGGSVAISASGSTIVVGSPHHASNGHSDNDGNVAIFSDSSGLWKMTASFNDQLEEWLGSSVAISGNGTTVAAVAPYRENGLLELTGAVVVYRDGSKGWKTTNTITNNAALGGIGNAASNPYDIGLSASGSTLVVGNPYTSSTTTDTYTGSVAVFQLASSGKWVRQATLRASDSAAGDEFGFMAALSANGSTIVAATTYTNSSGTQVMNKAYVFSNSSGSWKQTAELKKYFVETVAVSAKGSAVLIGDTAAGHAGEGLLYSLSAGKWAQTATISPAKGLTNADGFGGAVALPSGSAAWFGVASQNDGSVTGEGAVYLYVK